MNRENKAQVSTSSGNDANAIVVGSLPRPIIYRAWDDSQKYMAYQGTPDLETLQSFMFHFGDKKIMEYTGLNDKNGNKIFESDILLFEMLDGTKRHFKVWFTSGGFVINEFENDFKKPIADISFWSALSDMQTASFVNGNCQVIGNVFENPELLGK